MMKVQNIIHESTLALLPVKDIEYQTQVLEENRVYLVRETPLEIIKHACKMEWTTYDGRREAVIERTGYEKKVPIPINTYKKIAAFPTHGTKNIDCKWIFGNQIHHIREHPSNPKGSIVIFKNGQHLILHDVSYHILQQQYERVMPFVVRREDYIFS